MTDAIELVDRVTSTVGYLRVTLDDLVGPRVAPPDPGTDDTWLACSRLTTEPPALADLARASAPGRGTDRADVALSLFVQGYAFRVASAAIGGWLLTGAVLDVRPARTSIAVDRHRPNALRLDRAQLVDPATASAPPDSRSEVAVASPRATETSPTRRRSEGRTSTRRNSGQAPQEVDENRTANGQGGPDARTGDHERSLGTLHATVVDEHLALLVGNAHAAVRIGEALLWSNVGAACASSFGAFMGALPDRQVEIRERATEFFAAARPELAMSGRVVPVGCQWAWERSACCLWYRTDAGERCADCSLWTAEERAERYARVIAAQEAAATEGTLTS